METTSGRRTLVAVSPAGQETVRTLLRGCDADFVTSYAEAAVALTRKHYSVVIVGLHFGRKRKRMLDMIQLAREMEPLARIVAVTGSGASGAGFSGVRVAFRALGVEGPLDLTRRLKGGAPN